MGNDRPSRLALLMIPRRISASMAVASSLTTAILPIHSRCGNSKEQKLGNAVTRGGC